VDRDIARVLGELQVGLQGFCRAGGQSR
jgi:hypothetical protein